MQANVGSLVRWVAGGLSVTLVTGLVYRPHLLQGDFAPPVFPPQRIVSLNLAATSFVAVPCATFAGALCTVFAVEVCIGHNPITGAPYLMPSPL